MMNRLIPIAFLLASVAPVHAQIDDRTVEEQQARSLGLVSVDVTDETVGNVLAKLRKQTQWALEPFLTASSVLENRVTIKLDRQPLGKALAMLGLWPATASYGLTPHAVTPLWSQATVDHHPGVSLRMRSRRWQRGDTTGVIITTDAIQEGVAPMFFDVAKVLLEDGTELPLETCSLHSPHTVFVRNPPKQRALLITAKGSCFAQHNMKISIKAPTAEGRYTQGAFSISLKEWPRISISSKKAHPRLAMKHLYSHVKVVAKPGAKPIEDPGAIGLGRAAPDRSALNAWCGCRGKPMKSGSNEPHDSERVTEAHGYATWYPSHPMYDLEDLISVDVTLGVPTEYPFTSTLKLPARY